MRLFFLTLLIAIVAGVVSRFLPWWTIAPAAALIAFIFPLKAGKAFLAGFIAIFLVWLGFYLFFDARFDHELSIKMATVFPLGGNHWLVMIVGSIVGGLIGGMSALTGALFRKAIFDPPAPIRSRFDPPAPIKRGA